MCGIFLHFFKNGILRKELMKSLLCNYESIDHRGPDKHTLSIFGNCLAGFHRLAINDVSEKGDQPFELNEEFLMCNGEIYNYEELQEFNKFPLVSKSDCEILLHLFQKYGIEKSLSMIDGVFAIVYITNDNIFMIRDRIGVKPLFFSMNENELTIASEPIALEGQNKAIMEVLPSTFIFFSKSDFSIRSVPYFLLPSKPFYFDENSSINLIKNVLKKAVKKRLCSDRPIGCLLSGGLDSSLIASLLVRELNKKGIRLKTFSIGFPDSTDIIYARKVAKYLNTDHNELIITYDTALSYIPTVIKKIGSYDTTTIRASTPMYILCEWINKNFKEKVIFSGEGSDEIFCGYLYSHNAPTSNDLFDDSIRLVSNLYKYDVLRADRCTAGNSLEFREPFLDKELLDVVLSLSGELKKPKDEDGVSFEKHILRKAFTGYLPSDVLWRRKAAFSDAVSGSEKPWYKWIHEHIENGHFNLINFGGTNESNYYKTIFTSIYKNYKPNIPLWLPQWSDTGDEPSATVLNIYKKDEH